MPLPELSEQDLLTEFPQLSEVELVPVASGQKKVFKAKIGDSVVAVKAILIGPAQPETNNIDPNVPSEAEATLARLRREIAALSLSATPNLVRLGALASCEIVCRNQRIAIYSEEWIDGGNLRDKMARGPLSREEVKKLGLALCSAVEALSAARLVHRDIKPENVLLRGDGEFVLVDPGVALDVEGTPITAPGLVVGTPGYHSPEQLMPIRKTDLDIRSDLFAIGIVLYEALTGRHPFRKPGISDFQLNMAIYQSPHKRLGHANALEDAQTIEDIIDRLLAKKAHLRFRGAEDFRDALERSQ